MTQNAAHSISPGWRAELELGFADRGIRTELVHRRQRGPLAVQRPFHPEGPNCHLYLLHPPGGVVGGDQLDIKLDLQAGASALVTTPGATKFYRSAGPLARQTQCLTIADNATLEWFPQENILFPGARLAMDTHIDLAPEARFIGWELHCLGRPAISETFDQDPSELQGHADFRLRIDRGGAPLQYERLRIDSAKDLQGAARLRGQPVVGSFIATGVDKPLLEAVRGLLTDEHCGATLIDDLLLLRYLGPSTEQARASFVRVWTMIRKPLLGTTPCPPRIWST